MQFCSTTIALAKENNEMVAMIGLTFQMLLKVISLQDVTRCITLSEVVLTLNFSKQIQCYSVQNRHIENGLRLL